MRLFRPCALALLAAVVLGAQSAQGVSFYAEILTNDAFPFIPDTTGRVTVSVDLNPLGFDWNGSTTGPNTGLGTGLVSPGAPLAYTHLFDPTPDAASVLQAWLIIAVADDQLFPDGPEMVSVQLEGNLWLTGSATVNLLLGNITALGLVTFEGDTLDVVVSSSAGDFQVLASALKVKFEPVPEPGTLALAALGVALLAARRRAALRAPA